jgi:arsenite methyltransferase
MPSAGSREQPSCSTSAVALGRICSWPHDAFAPAAAIGVDMTEMMRTQAAAGAAECGLTNVDVLDGDATRLPLSDQSVDVVISNGVLNLVPDKHQAVGEIARVLKPGGRAQIADIVIGEVLPESALRDIDLWTG